MTTNNFKTPLSQVKFLGAARSGTTHFIRQRFTAVIMLLLISWFIYTMLDIASEPNAIIGIIAGSVLNLSVAILFVGNFLYHGYLGLQMILEDYIHNKAYFYISITLIKLFCIITFIAFIMAMLISLNSYIASSIVLDVFTGRIKY
jgi:succinate dehydrogenase / fumarate reductase membrane anchor subunit